MPYMLSALYTAHSPAGVMVWERLAQEGHLEASVEVPGSLESEKTLPMLLILGHSSCGVVVCTQATLLRWDQDWTQTQRRQGAQVEIVQGGTGCHPISQMHRGGLAGAEPGCGTVGKGAEQPPKSKSR